jgi:hypothetical protein
MNYYQYITLRYKLPIKSPKINGSFSQNNLISTFWLIQSNQIHNTLDYLYPYNYIMTLLLSSCSGLVPTNVHEF